MPSSRPPYARASGSPSAESPVLVGESPAIVRLRVDLAVAARTHAKVLIIGETGVGKEVVARLIHSDSPRCGRAFVPVNCSGIPEPLLESELFGHTRGSFTGAIRDKIGLVQQADHGTLFLDELGEMSLRMQAVLLRFTETGGIQQVGADTGTVRADVRLITATNRDLRQRIAEGAFREDLYYRLNVIQIQIPPLRARAGDVPLLMRHFLERAALMHQLAIPVLSPDAEHTLTAYPWPGNVRELRNIAERLVLLGRDRALTIDDLPQEVRDVRAATPTTAPPADPFRDSVTRGDIATSRIDELWDRMHAGEDFWTVVGEAYRSRQLTKTDLRAIVDRGLTETRGSYRALVRLVNLPAADYKKFHTFLYQQQCNLAVAAYRPSRTTPRVKPEPPTQKAS